MPDLKVEEILPFSTIDEVKLVPGGQVENHKNCQEMLIY